MTVLKDIDLNNNSIKQTFDDIIKSSEDKREYKAFILDNGLKLLLISDTDTDKSAAALSVNVGQMSDPREVQGLAHFLEHMLFLGTKKYPEENGFTKYLSGNGGSYNAITFKNRTDYYFDVATTSLVETLDRFAQFFIEPLLTESAVDREINAVNSEHERYLTMDNRRVYRITQIISDPKHDYNKYGTGNLETLKEMPLKEGIDVRQALLDFHNKWYSANIMSLVVLGKETINELKEVVIPLFSQIINKNVTPPEWPTHPYSDDYLRKEVSIVPIKDIRSLEIIFPIPDLVAHYKSLPASYLIHLIGHEGPGSLSSELKSRGLSNSLDCDSSNNKGFGFFSVWVDLTVDGIERTDQIIELIFQYINLLKKEGPKEWIHEERQRLRQIRFQFKDKEGPVSYVSNLASDPHYYRDFSLNEWLSAGFLLEEYSPEPIREVLHLLTPNRMQVVIVAKKFEGTTDLTEKWFGTQYKVEDIPHNKIDKWTECGLNERLSLPVVNDFIPSNFNLTKRENISEVFPQIIRNTDFSRVWYLQDNKYLKPKVFYAFKLTNPVTNDIPSHSVASSLFIQLLVDTFEEYTYSARLSGLFSSIQKTTNGLILIIFGFNEKLNLFLNTILQKLLYFKIDEKRFEIIKECYLRGIKNYTAYSLGYLLSYYKCLITCERYWSYEDLIDCLSEVTVERLTQFIPQLLSRFNIEALIHGNIEKSEALKVCDLFENHFKNSHFQTRPISLSQHYRDREIQLKDGSDVIYEITNAVHQTNAIRVNFQVGVEERVSTVSLKLIEELIREPFFNTLRTKEQLGYVVNCTVRLCDGVRSLSFIIESDYCPSYLNERIEAFISWSEKYINDMKSEEFESKKQSLITHKLEKTKQLFTYSSILWDEIHDKQYDFNRAQNEFNAIKQLTKEDILSFLKKYFSIDSPNRKKLTISILSANPINPKDSDQQKEDLLPAPKLKESVKIENIEEFKNRSAFYPLPKPFIDVNQIKHQDQ